MKKLITILLLASALIASAVEYRLGFTITVTNAPTEGDSLTINGIARTATNGTQSALAFTVGADAGSSATNLFLQLTAYQPSGLNVTFEGTNVVKLRVRNKNTALTVTSSGLWATLTLNSNTVYDSIPAAIPLSNETVETNKAYIANGFVIGINDYATNAFATNAAALTNYVTMVGVQTVSNKTLANATVDGSVITNSGVYSRAGAVTNWSIVTPIITTPVISGATASGLILSSTVNAGQNSITNVNQIIFTSPDGSFSGSLELQDTGDFAFEGANGAVTYAAANFASENYVGTHFLGNGYAGLGNLPSNPNGTNLYLYSIGLTDSMQTNSTTAGSNTFGGSIAYPRADITTIANGNNSGIDPGANTFIKLSGNTAIANIAGFVGGRDGRGLIVKNASAYNIVLLSESGLDAAATNRFSTAEYTIAAGDLVPIIYDSAESRWNVIGR